MKNEFDYLNNVKVDFSEYNLEELTDLERMKMINVITKSRNGSWMKAASIAACLTIVITLNQSVFAQNIINDIIIDDIIRSISTGLNHFVQVDDDSSLSVKIPDKHEEDPIASGSNENKLIIHDKTEISDHLNFEAKLPAYMPADYIFYGAELFKNSDGTVSGDYLNIYYKNHASGKSFVVMERTLNDDTAFTLTTDRAIEETKVNGCKAVLEDDRTLSWETGNISISITGRDALSRDELFEVAESVK